MKHTLLLTTALLALASACQGPDPNVTLRDSEGNYVTSSDFRAMERSEFLRAVRAGLEDFDEQLERLRTRANELGGESLEEFAGVQEELEEQRKDVVNELGRTEAALASDWPDRREDTLEAYYQLRRYLDEAYEEVLES